MSRFVSPRSTRELQERLWKSVEQERAYAIVHKNFIRRRQEIEKDLDMAMFEDENPPGESVKRRRRLTTLSIDAVVRASAEEVKEDIRKLFGKGETLVCTKNKNGLLCTNGKEFAKGEEVKIVINREEIIGTISSIEEEGVVLKNKDNKKLKILFEDIKYAEFMISNLSKGDY